MSRAGVLAAVVVVTVWVALALALHRRNAVWESERALWEDVIQKSRCNARAHLGLGFSYRGRQRPDLAIAEYRKGLACVGENAEMELQLLTNLGVALIWSQRFAEAAQVLERARAKVPYDPELMTNLAVAAFGMRDLARARALAGHVVAASPGSGHAWNVLGMVQADEGELAAARASFERAVALDPDIGVRNFHLGMVLDRQGDVAAACSAWRRALAGRLDPPTRQQVVSAVSKRCGPGATGR